MWYWERVPYLDIKNYIFNRRVAREIPEEFCREFQVIGIDRLKVKGFEIYTIGMVNPKDNFAIVALEFILGCTIRPFKIDIIQWANAVNRLYLKHYEEIKPNIKIKY